MGRKKIGRENHTVRLFQADWDKAVALGNGSASAAIEALIQQAPEPEAPPPKRPPVRRSNPTD